MADDRKVLTPENHTVLAGTAADLVAYFDHYLDRCWAAGPAAYYDASVVAAEGFAVARWISDHPDDAGAREARTRLVHVLARLARLTPPPELDASPRPEFATTLYNAPFPESGAAAATTLYNPTTPDLGDAAPRRRAPMDPAHRDACVDYYVRTHAPRTLAELLVDLEHEQGLAPAVDESEVES